MLKDVHNEEKQNEMRSRGGHIFHRLGQLGTAWDSKHVKFDRYEEWKYNDTKKNTPLVLEGEYLGSIAWERLR